MENSEHDNGLFLGPFQSRTLYDYYTALSQASQVGKQNNIIQFQDKLPKRGSKPGRRATNAAMLLLKEKERFVPVTTRKAERASQHSRQQQQQGATTHTHAEEEEPIGEISPATPLVANRYLVLPEAEIARILCNKFRPENLYKLRHLQGREDRGRDDKIILRTAV